MRVYSALTLPVLLCAARKLCYDMLGGLLWGRIVPHGTVLREGASIKKCPHSCFPHAVAVVHYLPCWIVHAGRKLNFPARKQHTHRQIDLERISSDWSKSRSFWMDDLVLFKSKWLILLTCRLKHTTSVDIEATERSYNCSVGLLLGSWVRCNGKQFDHFEIIPISITLRQGKQRSLSLYRMQK